MQKRNRENLANGFTTSAASDQVLSQAIRFVKGGRVTFIGYIELAAANGDITAKAWWNVFEDLLPTHRERVGLGAVCEAAGVRPDQLMAVVVSTAMQTGKDVADLVAAAAHPSIVRASVKSAQRIGGKHAGVALEDRRMLHQHHGFVPTPKGTTVNVNANASASAKAAAAASAEPSVPSFADSVSDAIDSQSEIQDETMRQPVEDAELVED